MTLWDGLETNDQDPTSNRILIVGATNRAQDLDAAILRRMPTRYHVPLPNLNQRLKIFQLILDNELLDADVDLEQLANDASNYTGSDINEICRQAAMQRIVELCHQRPRLETRNDGAEEADNALESLRPIKQADFLQALKKVRDTHQNHHSFNRIALDWSIRHLFFFPWQFLEINAFLCFYRYIREKEWDPICHSILEHETMVQNNENTSSSNRFSLSSLIPTQYVVIGSAVLIGLLNMYKGLFRFSFGFLAGMGIGAALGFIFADSPTGQYILKLRSKPQRT